MPAVDPGDSFLGKQKKNRPIFVDEAVLDAILAPPVFANQNKDSNPTLQKTDKKRKVKNIYDVDNDGYEDRENCLGIMQKIKGILQNIKKYFSLSFFISYI